MTEEQFDKLMLVLEEFGKKLDEFMMFWNYQKPYPSLPFTFGQTEFLPDCTCADKGKTSAINPCPRHDSPKNATSDCCCG